MENEMMDAVRNGDIENVKLLLDNGIDINIRDRFGGTALNLASSGDHTDIVRLLLDRGANPNIRIDTPI